MVSDYFKSVGWHGKTETLLIKHEPSNQDEVHNVYWKGKRRWLGITNDSKALYENLIKGSVSR